MENPSYESFFDWGIKEGLINEKGEMTDKGKKVLENRVLDRESAEAYFTGMKRGLYASYKRAGEIKVSINEISKTLNPHTDNEGLNQTILMVSALVSAYAIDAELSNLSLGIVYSDFEALVFDHLELKKDLQSLVSAFGQSDTEGKTQLKMLGEKMESQANEAKEARRYTKWLQKWEADKMAGKI